MRWNPHYYPPGGYVYTDPEGIRHEGTTLDRLISGLVDYRARRGGPMGDPVKEVHTQLCERFPDRAMPGDPSPQVTLSDGRASVVAHWLRLAWQKSSRRSHRWVPEDEVKRRAAICAKCPMMHAMPRDFPQYVDALDALSFQLRAGKDAHSWHLKSCRAFGTDLRLDVLLEQPKQEGGPPGCWKG